MNDYCIAIGVSSYEKSELNVESVHRGLLHFLDWARRVRGISPTNLLSLGEDGQGVDINRLYGELNSFIKGVKADGGAPRRLFLYYGGHGVEMSTASSDERALYASDTNPCTPFSAISYNRLLNCLKKQDLFQCEFHFIEACREVVPYVETCGPTGSWCGREVPMAMQCVYLATASGLTSSAPSDRPLPYFTEAVVRQLTNLAPEGLTAGELANRIREDVIATRNLEGRPGRQVPDYVPPFTGNPEVAS